MPHEHSFMCFNLETHRSEIAYLNHRREDIACVGIPER